MFRAFLSASAILGVLLLTAAPAPAAGNRPIPVPGTVTLLDLGSECIPCELQDRIVHRVMQEFEGRVEAVFLDVEKEPEHRRTYGVEIIPTLVFYDRKGHEVERRSGYMKEGDMRRLLQRLVDEK